MFSIDEIKKKRESYERKIEEIVYQFAKELPLEVTIDSVVVINRNNKMECGIKLVVADLNG
jgi:hypothetical protein